MDSQIAPLGVLFRLPFFSECCKTETERYHCGLAELLHELPVVAVLITQSNIFKGPKKIYSSSKVMQLQSLPVVKYGINLMK